MVTREFCASQILRLSGLPFYPVEDAAAFELLQALEEHTDTAEHAKAVIDELLYSCERCPIPADIRRVCLEKRPARPNGHEICARCGGSGWVIREVGGYEGAAKCEEIA